MHRRLHISRASGATFGRFSERSIDIGDHEFVVIHGPNESGKSTLSELIAWVVAGRHGSAVDTMKYGAKDDKIGGTVSGTFNGHAYSIGRTFKVRDSNTGRAPAEPEPVITLDGRSISLAEWEDLIAVASGQDFALRYRVTDSDGPVSVRELLESLAVGARIGLTPAAAMSQLEDIGSKMISAPSGRNVQTDVARFRRELDEARRAHDEALAASRTIDELNERLARITEQTAAIDALVRETQSERDALAAAAELLEVRRRIDDEEVALAAIGPVPDEWRIAITRRVRTEDAIAELRAAERAVRDASDSHDKACAALGVDSSVADQLSLDASVEQQVTNLTLATRSHRDAISKANESIRVATVKLGQEHDQFNSLAGDLGLTPGEAEALASRHVDDVVFNDAISRWLDAAKEVIAAGVKVKPATERAEARRLELEEAQRAWDGLDLPVDPEQLHRSGSGFTVEAGQPKRPGLGLILGAAGLVVAATIFNKWVGVAATIVAVASLLVSVRRQRTTVSGGSPQSGIGLDEASALVNARTQFVIADTARSDASSSHETAVALEQQLGRSAIETLRHMGISSCEGPEHAAMLRRKRAALTSVRDEIEKLQSSIALDQSVVAESTAQLAEAEARLSAIAAECGTPRYGSGFDTHVVTRIRDVISTREALERAQLKLGHARAELTQATDQPSLATLSGDSLASEMQRAAGIASARHAKEATISTLTERLADATRDKPRLGQLLEDPLVSVSSLSEKLAETDDRLTELREQASQLTEESGAAKSRIAELEVRADLPEINHRIGQADSQLKDATIRGVAGWFARRVVADIKDEYERDNQPALIRDAGNMVRHATHGTWRGLRVSEDGTRLEVLWGDTKVFAESSMSAGARNLLRLAVRIAVADSHGDRHGVSLPLICDDPTNVIDSFRSPEVFALLSECSRRRQVIVMTHDERTVELATAAGAVAIDINAR